jgi:glycerophosphoryl diester phosphodiesterase
LQSFDLELLQLAPKFLPNLRRSALFAPSQFQWVLLQMHSSLHQIFDHPGLHILKKAHTLGVEVISPYIEYVTPEFIRLAHSLKLRVIPWTVNDPKEMQRLIEYGVDGLISDYPNRLDALVKEMGPHVQCRTIHSDSQCHTPLHSF